jgi:hypothetical protein
LVKGIRRSFVGVSNDVQDTDRYDPLISMPGGKAKNSNKRARGDEVESI